ncbi:MAG TPA: glutamate racemase [Candidatus Peribacterales bacterium]|nr:glutamate racemase [Candidatus Peribacterales bacterium]
MLGIFDSGVGGLNVFAAIRTLLPNLQMTYLGDNARTPYGDRSRETITAWTKECCSFLFDQGCTLIVLACNTASAETLRVLQQEWLPNVRKHRNKTLNILGVIRPLAEEAVEHTRNGCIGVVGTRSTISSGTYIEELSALRPALRVVQQACPLLVPLVEEGWINKPETRKILRTYLASLKSQNPDVLILGCTHYEALHHLFQRQMGRRCTVLHTPTIVAQKLADYILRHPEYALPQTGRVHFFTTGDEERFQRIGSIFCPKDIEHVQKADIPHLGANSSL